jgi:hypothetical protein
VKRKGGRKRGRPPQPTAKRRTTTRQGRATGFDPIDPGTHELRWHRQLATGTEGLPHDEPLAILYGHGLISTEQYNTGRDVAELMARIDRGGIVATVWQRILGRPAGGVVDYAPLSVAAERAARLLHRLLDRLRPEEARLFVVCAGYWTPLVLRIARGDPLRRNDRQEIVFVCAGLDRIARYWAPGRQEILISVSA